MSAQIFSEIKFTALLSLREYSANPATYSDIIVVDETLSFHRWIAIKRPEKVKSLLLSSPGWRQESPDVKAALQSVSDALLVNKAGRGGDDTGTIPSGPLEDIIAYFIGSDDRLADAREELRTRFQQRYGTGQTAHDINWLFVAVYDRKAIPQDLMEKITCPVLILRGGEDSMVSPERATEEWRR